MPTYIIKMTDKKTNKDYYLEWSSIVDAPVTYGVSLDEFKEYYQKQYGIDGMRNLDDRLKRVEAKGHSCLITNAIVEDFISGNRAGKNETELSYDEILQEYCLVKH